MEGAGRRVATSLNQADNAAEDVERSLRDVRQTTNRAADEMDRFGREARTADTAVSGMATSLRTLAVGAAAYVGIQGIKDFLVGSVDAASDLGESINAVNVIFGEAADQVIAFGQDTSDAVFLAASEFNQLAATTGNLLQGYGLDMNAAADATIELTKRAADVASVFNPEGGVGAVLEAFNAALRGETEQIRRFTGSFSIEEVKKFGQELFGVTGELTSQQQVLAAVEYIMAKTAATQGDAANTAGSLANQQRDLNEKWITFQTVVGEQLVPALERLLPVLIDVTSAAASGIPVWAAYASDAASAVKDTFGFAGNIGQALFDVARFDLTGAVGNLQDAGDAMGRVQEITAGTTSLYRDFIRLLADGEDNVSDYANAIVTLADANTLTAARFADVTGLASQFGVDLEAQASAIRAVLTEGELTGVQAEFLTRRFIDLALAVDRLDAWYELRDSLPIGARFMGDLSIATEQAIVSLNSLDPDLDGIEGFALAIGNAKDAADGAVKTIDLLPDSVQAVGERAGLSISEMSGFNDELERAATAADTFRAATLELTDPFFAAAQAQERLTKAQEDLTTTQADSDATAQDVANAQLDVARAVLEADAAARQLGSVDTGLFQSRLDVLGLALGTTSDEIVTILENAGILSQTDIGIAVEYLINDLDLRASLQSIPDGVIVPVRYEVDAFSDPSRQFQQPGGAPPPSTGPTVIIQNPVDHDIVGNAGQAGHIISAVGTVSGRGNFTP